MNSHDEACRLAGLQLPCIRTCRKPQYKTPPTVCKPGRQTTTLCRWLTSRFVDKKRPVKQHHDGDGSGPRHEYPLRDPRRLGEELHIRRGRTGCTVTRYLGTWCKRQGFSPLQAAQDMPFSWFYFSLALLFPDSPFPLLSFSPCSLFSLFSFPLFSFFSALFFAYSLFSVLLFFSFAFSLFV